MTHTSPKHLVVIGGGHVGKAVAHLAHWLGFRVAVCDDRAEYCTAQENPDADEFYPVAMGDLPSHLRITSSTYLVCTSRGAVDLQGRAVDEKGTAFDVLNDHGPLQGEDHPTGFVVVGGVVPVGNPVGVKTPLGDSAQTAAVVEQLHDPKVSLGQNDGSGDDATEQFVQFSRGVRHVPPPPGGGARQRPSMGGG